MDAGSSHSAVVPSETSVTIGEAKETLGLLFLLRGLASVCHCLKLGWIIFYLPSPSDEVEKTDCGDVDFILLSFDEKIITSKEPHLKENKS